MKLSRPSTKQVFLILLIIIAATIAILTLSPPKPAPPPGPKTSPTLTPKSSPAWPIDQPPPPHIQQQLQQQTQDDLLYGQTILELQKQQPWLKQLPITTNNFRIVYDFEKQSFRIRILTVPASDEELQTIKQQALAALEKIGVDTATQPYYFIKP